MEKEKLEQLKGKLEHLGFGKALHDEVEQCIRMDHYNFSLKKDFAINRDYEDKKDDMTCVLRFFKLDNDQYDFSYLPALKDQQDPSKDKKYIFSASEDISVKEAYNLLHGRSVQKTIQQPDGTTTTSWMVLGSGTGPGPGEGIYDLHPIRESQGFDLSKVLDQHQIQESRDASERQDLIRNLERGQPGDSAYFQE